MELKHIQKLTPERRSKELRKLIETLKKDIEKKKQQIKDAEEMLTRSVEDERVLENIQVPKAKPITPEFIEVKTAPESLEKRIDPAIEHRRQEVEQLAQRPTTEIYKTIKDIYMQTEEKGYRTEQQQEQVYLANQALEKKKKDIETGEYEPTEKAEHLMTSAERMIKEIYKR